jgi:hypothetical protein
MLCYSAGRINCGGDKFLRNLNSLLPPAALAALLRLAGACFRLSAGRPHRPLAF